MFHPKSCLNDSTSSRNPAISTIPTTKAMAIPCNKRNVKFHSGKSFLLLKNETMNTPSTKTTTIATNAVPCMVSNGHEEVSQKQPPNNSK